MRAEMLLAVETPPSRLGRLGNGRGWYTLNEGLLTILDDNFAPMRRFEIGASFPSYAVSPDLTHVVVGGQDRISLLDEYGKVVWSVQHAPWGTRLSLSGSCEFSSDGSEIWVTVPEPEEDEDGEVIEGEEQDDGADAPYDFGDQWWVIDAATGVILERSPLGCEATGSAHVRHPDGVHMGLNVGEGQDGSNFYWGCRRGGDFHVTTKYDLTRSLADIHPEGTAYLTVPRESDGIMVHDFASHSVIARRPNSDLLLLPGEWPIFAGYLDCEYILVETVDRKWNFGRHIVLQAQGLDVLGEVCYPPSVGPGRWMDDGSDRDGRWMTRIGDRLFQWRLAK
ncbi:hypothetical protein [Streptomyces virginiae]|uniref:hypothetical protein n=1 Tax=Streptomyces virginiae TaxID=1961 RepID=UPI003418825E